MPKTRASAQNGTSSSPELVALAPLTTCRNSGRNTIAPNMLTPITSDIAVHTANTRLLNSPSGRIGSTARRSWPTVSAPSTSAAAASPRIWGDAHGYWVPPHDPARSRLETAATSSPAPSQSTECSRRANGRSSTTDVTTSARIPIGMLM